MVGIGLVSSLARGDDESGLTGGDSTVIQPATTSLPHTKHKKHKHVSAAAQTNAVTNPAVMTNAVTNTTPATNDVTSPASPALTNATPTEASGPATPASSEGHDGRVGTLATSDLREFAEDPVAVQQLLAQALELTTQNLSYKYGSSDPQNGGMDCSGTVYHLLTQAGMKDVPRDASEMYRWVWTSGRFESVVSTNPDSFEMARLKPGDLLFWSGTYRVDRDPPITHVMIYLGVNRATGRRVMVGASEGRKFNGVSRYGVSVFDLTLPKAPAGSDAPEDSSELHSRFVGYGSVPGLGVPSSN